MDLLDIKFCEIFEDVKKIPIGILYLNINCSKILEKAL